MVNSLVYILRQSYDYHSASQVIMLLWLSAAIWRHWSGSILAQKIACCLTALNHYLYQYWFIVIKVQWQSPENNFINLRITYLTVHSHLLGVNELRCFSLSLYRVCVILTLPLGVPSWYFSLSMAENTWHRVQRITRWAPTSRPEEMWDMMGNKTKHCSTVSL